MIKFILPLLEFLILFKFSSQVTTCLIDSLGACPTKKNLLWAFTNTSIYNSNGKSIISFIGELKDNLKSPVGIESTGERCNMAKTKCYTMLGMNFPNLCYLGDYFLMKMIFNQLEPPIYDCPVKKGIYRFKNITIDHSIWLKLMQMAVGKYDLNYVFYTKKEGKIRDLACFRLAFRIQVYGSRRH